MVKSHVWGGMSKWFHLYIRGGTAKWLQYYIGGEGSLATPKSDYVICARPLMANAIKNFYIFLGTLPSLHFFCKTWEASWREREIHLICSKVWHCTCTFFTFYIFQYLPHRLYSVIRIRKPCFYKYSKWVKDKESTLLLEQKLTTNGTVLAASRHLWSLKLKLINLDL